jgi:hypothetical protein
MDARERHLAVLHGEEPDKVNVAAAAGLRVGPQGGWMRRLSARGLCITHIVPPYRPMFFFSSMINPNLADVVYSQTYFREKGLNKVRHTFETPVGSVYAVVGRNPNDNVAEGHTEIPFVKEPGDWNVVNYVFQGMLDQLRPNYGEMVLDQEDLGRTGVTIAVVDRTPFQRAWIELASLERAAIDFKEEPDELLRFVAIQRRFHEKAAEITAGCPSSHVLLIDNITNVISPRLYEAYCQPYYTIYTDAFRGTDKILCVHFDGRFRHLKQGIQDSTFDVIDSFTVPPTGDVSIPEAKTFFPEKRIFVNLPPHLANAGANELRAGYSKILNEWGSKVLTIEHVEDLPPDALERHLSAALDVCGYPD